MTDLRPSLQERREGLKAQAAALVRAEERLAALCAEPLTETSSGAQLARLGALEDERDRVADLRDRIADEWDALALLRDAAAEHRDVVALQRERRTPEQDAVDGLAATLRHLASVERDWAAADRLEARRDRERAARDRAAARAAREAAAALRRVALAAAGAGGCEGPVPDVFLDVRGGAVALPRRREADAPVLSAPAAAVPQPDAADPLDR
ncbi:hypothetical protein [Motilibacter aurantiacus]|uniref:hypothetical protein n=1 Tax=Motilibacter aurantiacus TaxID=2714955 RepID=UPI001408579D|nr:hypothetical protein [Motilibacter aurantiacus]NHC47606.1 hypothetical protein [Motilibacter aurantiacus]